MIFNFFNTIVNSSIFSLLLSCLFFLKKTKTILSFTTEIKTNKSRKYINNIISYRINYVFF